MKKLYFCDIRESVTAVLREETFNSTPNNGTLSGNNDVKPQVRKHVIQEEIFSAPS